MARTYGVDAATICRLAAASPFAHAGPACEKEAGLAYHLSRSRHCTRRRFGWLAAKNDALGIHIGMRHEDVLTTMRARPKTCYEPPMSFRLIRWRKAQGAM